MLTTERQGGGIIDQSTGGKNTKPDSGLALYGQTATASRLECLRWSATPLRKVLQVVEVFVATGGSLVELEMR